MDISLCEHTVALKTKLLMHISLCEHAVTLKNQTSDGQFIV